MTFSIETWQPGTSHGCLRYGLLAPQGYPTPDDEIATVLLFWPGLGGTVKNALGFFNRLLPTVQRIAVPDLQGFGLNDAVPLPSLQVHQQQAAAFLQHILARYPKAKVVVGGISLGALLQASAVATPLPSRVVGQCWVAPAFKAHPGSFSLQYQLQSAIKAMLGKPISLPYRLEQLTRNPQVLADERHHAHSRNFRVPMGYLWQIRALGNRVRQQLCQRPAVVPTFVALPGQDVVCCPDTMGQVAWQMIDNSAPNVVKLVAYNNMYHDMLLEPDMPIMADEVVCWIESLLLQK